MPAHLFSDKQKQTDIEKSYEKLAEEAELNNPGINDLLSLYGEFQVGLSKSQEYLQLFQKTFTTTTSNTSAQ